MTDFPNIIYNIKDPKYDQYSIIHWIKYYVFFSDYWINPFELFLIKTRKKLMKNISVDETDLIEWLSICDSIIDLLVRYKVSSIFPFNLCYQTLIALKDSINYYKTNTNN